MYSSKAWSMNPSWRTNPEDQSKDPSFVLIIGPKIPTLQRILFYKGDSTIWFVGEIIRSTISRKPLYYISTFTLTAGSGSSQQPRSKLKRAISSKITILQPTAVIYCKRVNKVPNSSLISYHIHTCIIHKFTHHGKQTSFHWTLLW